MGTLLFIFGSLLMLAALLSIAGMAAGDIKTLNMQIPKRQFKRTKHQKRPLVTAIIGDEISDRCIDSLCHSDYPKKEVILAGERIRGTLVLIPARDHIFEPSLMGDLVRQMTQNLEVPAIEILRDYKTPRTLPELMRTYHDIIVAPFIAVRQAFHITLPQTRWSMIVRPSVPWHMWHTRLYCTFRWLVACANALTLAYIVYVAAVLYQPEYLQIYLGGFAIWLVLAINRYPYFSLSQKIAYLILAPVPLGYLALLAFYAPFSPLVRRIRAATGGLVWRSSHQSLA